MSLNKIELSEVLKNERYLKMFNDDVMFNSIIHFLLQNENIETEDIVKLFYEQCLYSQKIMRKYEKYVLKYGTLKDGGLIK